MSSTSLVQQIQGTLPSNVSASFDEIVLYDTLTGRKKTHGHETHDGGNLFIWFWPLLYFNIFGLKH